MSSTYSSDLRIQLMGTGDQAGTWGATTNNNYQYILEQAIAGVQSVALTSSPYSLTYLNGATSTLANNQAICAALIFTGGVTGGACTVNAPYGSQKTYIIYNNTTSPATAITMQVSGGGASVVIPAGVTTSVYTDGTVFYSGASGTTGNFAINGTGTATTPTAGDNSTKIATTAFTTTAIQAAYPVGSIYMNASNGTNPATLLGFGTWSALAAGKMLLGNGGGYSAGGSGGSATTSISSSNLPSHTHGSSGLSASSSTSVNINDPSHTHTYTFKSVSGGTLAGGDPNSVGNVSANTGSAVTGITATASTSTSISGNTDATGSGSAFTTISPYLVVYMWQRTA